MVLWSERKLITQMTLKMETPLSEDFARVLEILTEADRRVVSLWFGLKDGRYHSQEEIAEELGVYPGYVYLTQLSILNRMKRFLRRRKLKDFLD